MASWTFADERRRFSAVSRSRKAANDALFGDCRPGQSKHALREWNLRS